MPGDPDPQIKTSSYACFEITKAPNWHALVALDLLFNNLATGLFLVAAVAELSAPGSFGPAAKLAYPIALVLLLADLSLLVLDLGDPLRFHHMLRVFKPSSPMSFGTWSLTVFSLVLTAIAALEAVAALGLMPGWSAGLEWARRAAVVVGLLPAFGSVSYKGVLFSTSAQPGWKDARWLGGYLVNSALMLGCAEWLALCVLGGHPRTAAALRVPLAILLVVNAIPSGLLFADLRPVCSRIGPGGAAGLVVPAAFVGATLIPLALLIAGGGPASAIAAVSLVVVWAVAVRSLIIKIPHAIPGRADGQQSGRDAVEHAG